MQMHLCNPISTHCLCFFLSTLLFISLARSRSLQIVTETENEIEKPPFPSVFSFDWSSKAKNRPPISLVGGAARTNSAVGLAHPVSSIIYNNKPIDFVGSNPGFSSHFSFSFSTIPGNGTELSFFLIPTDVESSLQSSNVLQSGLPPNSVSVELVSSIESGNRSESFLKIKVGGHLVAQSSGLPSTNSIKTHDGEKLNCWIDYNGVSKRMQVRVGKSTEDSTSGMISVFLSYPVDLTELLLKHKYFASMRYSCGNSDESVSIFSWSFSVGHGAKHMMHSEPLDPHSFVVKSIEDHHHKRVYHSWGLVLIMLFVAAACGALMMWYIIVSRWKDASMEVSVHPIEAGYEKILMFEGAHVKGYLELEDLE